jgi:hypothetical protein
VGRVSRGLVASSGYLGAAVVGCLLVAATRVERWAHVLLLGLGAFMPSPAGRFGCWRLRTLSRKLSMCACSPRTNGFTST